MLAIEMKAYKRSKYPNVPEHAILAPKYSDKTANGLATAIRDKIRLDGYFMDSIKSRDGISLLVACIEGKFIAIEIKAGADSQRPDQAKVEKDIQRSGGMYFIARAYSGFFEWYNQLKNKGAAL